MVGKIKAHSQPSIELGNFHGKLKFGTLKIRLFFASSGKKIR